jgi:phosphoribosylformimino-5-aminoimidazole carboxamide ribotide isomerase
MTKFRPCIDLHNGHVKQIVGSSLRDADVSTGNPAESIVENFVSDHSADWFAQLYARDRLTGGHVIKLGQGNDEAARSALAAYPDGMQIGGGIDVENASQWLDQGASHVIVTSWLFDTAGRFQVDRLLSLVRKIGARRLVIDLSCKRTKEGWTVAMNRWQTLTDLQINNVTLERLAKYCDEFLIHAADVEGLCQGIDEQLVQKMGAWGQLPMTYAGGVASMVDVDLVEHCSDGKVDVTVGSALDLFGGQGVTYDSLVQRNRIRSNPE